MRRLRLDRRGFLRVSALGAGGLLLATTLPVAGCDARGSRRRGSWSAWVALAETGDARIHVNRMEMGQGITTALAMIIAEEMDLDWARVSIAPAPLDDAFGRLRTEDSDGVRENWAHLRRLGATGRALLQAAAAARWDVPLDACETRESRVRHPTSGRELDYGDLARDAARRSLDTQPPLKEPADFRLIGSPIPRKGAQAMLDGSLRFAADLDPPGALAATALHGPHPGARPASIDDTAARSIQGFKTLVPVDDALVVVGADFHGAFRAREALAVDWTGGEAPPDSEDLEARLVAGLEENGTILSERGDVSEGFAHAATRIDVVRRDAIQAHAPMEPMSCVADARGDRCELWASTQNPWGAYHVALHEGLDPLPRLLERVQLKLTKRASDRILVHPLPMGGGFGRRLESDFVRQAVVASRAVRAPVKLLWTREEDLKADRFRPASAHRIEAAADAEGALLAWRHRICGFGIQTHGATFPYRCPNVRIEVRASEVPLRTGSWRATSHTSNVFARETGLDALAHRLGVDPLTFRLTHLEPEDRLARVLRVAAERAGWGAARAAGTGLGIAGHLAKDSAIALVLEIEESEGGQPLLRRAVCAVDCGVVVNALGARAQLQGGIAFGLSAALTSEITLRDGVVEQQNLDGYAFLRFDECPETEVHFLASAAPPGGIGELGVMPTAAALANAVRTTTGRDVAQLPLARHR